MLMKLASADREMFPVVVSLVMVGGSLMLVLLAMTT